MKKKTFLIFILLIFFAGVYFNAPLQAQEKISAGAKTANQMKLEKISLNVPQIGKGIEKYVLPNGMKFLIKEDKELPLVEIGVLVNAGERYENKDKHGVANLCAKLLNKGGTKKYTADEISKELDYRAIFTIFVSSTDSTIGVLSVLSKDLNLGLSMFADMLMNPAFNKDKFDLEKRKLLSSIDRIKDSPDALRVTKFYELIYKDHPYGWDYKKDTVEKISTDDLIKWHEKYFAPNNTIMTICGDFDSDKIKKTLNDIFGKWEKIKIDFPKIAPPPDDGQIKCLIVDKKVPQAFVSMGFLGIKKDNPDRVALEIMCNILNSPNFKNRMYYELREKRGLTYGVSAGFTGFSADEGIFNISYSTSTKNTYESVKLVLDAVRYLCESTPADEELNYTRKYYVNSFIFDLMPINKILSNTAELEYYELPRDYYANYINNVEKVTKEDILRCARQYLHPDKIKIVIVGDAEKIRKDMEKIAPVTVISDKE